MVSVVQRECAAKNPRATFKTSIDHENTFADHRHTCNIARDVINDVI